MGIELPRGEGCSACGACLAVCPVDAIQMKASADGFQYPAIQEDKCVSCGKCVKVCNLRATEEMRAPMAAFAAVGHCDDLVQNSASGGVFASLATQWVKEGGLVAGAVMDTDGESIQVFHELADCGKGISRMQGSKYVQSDAWNCYKDLVGALRQGKQVLFAGIPCQVSAVKRITGDPDNLVTMDLICHGVPSLQMLNDYVQVLNRRVRGKTKKIVFRDKSKGKSYCARIDVMRGKNLKQLYLKARFMSYYKHFLDGTIQRDSCYVCPYACTNRVSDITVGDYWGVEKHHNEIVASQTATSKNHWSCLLVNTQKGEKLLAKYGHSLEMYPSKVLYVAESNQQLNTPNKKPPERDNTINLYREKGYAAIEREYIHASGGSVRYFWRLYKELRHNKGAGKRK